MKNNTIDNIIPYDFINKRYIDKPQENQLPIKISVEELRMLKYPSKNTHLFEEIKKRLRKN